jgi:CRISPR-associated protein Csx16
MSVWFVSRHSGAGEWAKSQGLHIDHWVEHLSVGDVSAGDMVIGILPVNLVAEICGVGARYVNLSLNLPYSLRGQELSMAELIAAGAKLEEFVVNFVR